MLRRTVWLPLLAAACCAQDFSQRGYLETRLVAYPQTAPNDSGRLVSEALLRYEANRRLGDWRLFGAFDARTDTHRQVERDWGLSWQDRGLRRPAFSIRRLSAIYNRGPVTLELGKQFVRWGKTDILIPTDRFAPRDYLSVVDNDFLAVTAGRLTLEKDANTLDLVWVPRFTPSRVPLLNQRWVVLPEGLPAGLEFRDLGARYPGGSQFGARFNHVGAGYEASLSFYDGFNHLPLLDYSPQGLRVDVQRVYPQMRMYGGDFAIPTRYFTVKGEAGYFTTTTRQADEYALYVVQLERQSGEWLFVGGYAGQAVTTSRSNPDFSPDRGLARAIVGRASYTIDTNRSVAVETAIRQNGKGLWLRAEYSQALGPHWRATTGFALIRGAADDFLGQYRRNSHAALGLRYSF